MDGIQTTQFSCVGGLITNMDFYQQGQSAPGSAIRLVNFEPAVNGGYSRIQGYLKYDNASVPGSGAILGVAVFESMVLACRGTDIYRSTGTGWTRINGADTRTSASVYRHATYGFLGTPKIALVDGVNRPCAYTSLGAYSLLTNAPLGAEHVAEFRGRLWFAKDNLVTYSAPLADNDFTAGSGGGQINVTHKVTGLGAFRDQLIVFSDTAIMRITGNSSADFQMRPVSNILGCVHPDTIIEANGDVFYLGPDGIRTFAASDLNEDFNLANIGKQIQGNLTSLFGNYSRFVSFPIRRKNQIRLLGYQSSLPAAINQGFIGAVQSGLDATGWAFSETLGIKANVIHSDYNSNGSEVIVFGNDDGFVYRLEAGNTFDGANIQAIYQTPYLSLSDVNVRKSFRKMKVFFGDTSSYTINAALKLDFDRSGVVQPNAQVMTYVDGSTATYGSATYGTSRYGATNTPYGELMLVGAGFAGSIIFISEAPTPPFTIKSIALETSTYGRK